MPYDDQYPIESEIRAAFESGAAAWNRGDLDAYLAGYLDSDSTRYISGSGVITGKEAIAAAYRARFTSPERMGTLQLSRLEISVLSETDALVYGELNHTLAGQTGALVFTVHLHQVSGVWRMVTDHTTALE